MLQRHRTVLGLYGRRRPAIQAREFLLEKCRVAQRRRHEQEARARQRQQRHLPRHATVAVRVIMKFIHHHVVNIRVRAFAQGDVGENLRRAAENGRVAIHGGVARAEANVVGTELAAERHPFFVHERLDRAGVNGALPFRERLEVQRRGHK